MELKTESMKNMKKTVEKCLDELMQKTDLTPAETKAALDGFKLHDELCCRIEDCEKEEKKSEQGGMYSERGYSMHGEPYREYHITSYGMPERSYSHPNYGVHGWYQSNYPSAEGGYARLPGYPDEHMSRNIYDPYYAERGMGYSRHSISDRAVSSLEQLFDVAASDYEKQELRKYISLIRNEGMRD